MFSQLNYTIETPDSIAETETSIGLVTLEFFHIFSPKGMCVMLTKLNTTQLLFMPDIKISFPCIDFELFKKFTTAIVNEIHQKVMKKGTQDFELDCLIYVPHGQKSNWKVSLKMGKYAEWKEYAGRRWIEPTIENHEIVMGEEGFELILRSNKRFNDWRLESIHERLDWQGIRLENRNLSKAILINFDLSHTEFHHCNFKHCIFTGSNLNHVTFFDCNLEDTIWGKQQRVQSKVNSVIIPYLKNGNHIQESSFVYCNFQNSILDGSTFENCLFNRVDMDNIQNQELQFINCHFS